MYNHAPVLTQVEVRHFGGAHIVMVAAGLRHSAAVGAQGGLWTWGDGEFGRQSPLGHNDEQEALYPTHLAGEALGGGSVVVVAAAGLHTLAVVDDGSLWVWGFGGRGQLGLGDNANRLAPVKVAAEAFGGSRVLMAACGEDHTLATTEDGVMWTCGDGEDGRLGHTDRVERLVFTRISAQHFGNAKIVSASAGSYHSSAVTEHGVLYTWGKAQGLRHGTEECRLVPQRVAAQLLQGARVGRCHSLLPLRGLAFAMGTHARLGCAAPTDTAAGGSRKSRRQQCRQPAATDTTTGCAYESMPGELVKRVVEACVSWPEGRGGQMDGVVRLLGGGMMNENMST